MAIDRNFPHADGGIGEWGLDIRTVPPRLQSPTSRKDLMGYCNPQWISDYTFAALASRRSAVSVRRLGAPAPARRASASTCTGPWSPTERGRPSWGRPLAGEAPAGQPEPAQVLDAAGRVVDEITVYRTGYGHGAGASFDVPAGARRPGWKALAIPGGWPPRRFRARSQPCPPSRRREPARTSVR